MIRAGILGVTGYAGIELLRLLLNHPEVEVTTLVSGSTAGEKISSVYPHLKGICDIELEELNIETISKKCDVVFTSLPHGASDQVIADLYHAGLKVIDLSGDYRYDDVEVYEKWYNTTHKHPELLKESVYGLCELYREKIKTARLIGNPGCYTTTSILGAAPLIKGGFVSTKNIIVDAKSGVTGAGRGIHLDYHFSECTESMKAYKIATHRHTSEIEQEYSKLAGQEVLISFTPHLVPMKRGIYSTIYMNLTDNYTDEELLNVYRKFYENCPFISIYDSVKIPESNHVNGSNYVDIGLLVDKRLKRVVVVAALDNLNKGAAGQAVQNLNLMFGLPETTGLSQPGFYL
ncbi:MAG: N-acetyl-gamma-glutamyl-phosphate reductase [Clostridia bacterium]|nr:N-acetyl-gamma-glutamyl-phosphate reductase [Clostridia bacterium]